MRRSLRLLSTAAVATSLSFFALAAQAKVKITVDLDAQTIHVDAKDQSFDWKVSTGKPGYDTPAGSYGVLWMDKDHHSDEYEGAYMPNAIFFAPGFAIHGFGKSPWGHAASHGCVRLPVAKSAILYDLVKAEGAEVRIVGGSPASQAVASRLKQNREAAGSVEAHDASQQTNVVGGYEQARAIRPYDRQGDEQPAYEAVSRDQASYDRGGYNEDVQQPPAPRRSILGGLPFFGGF